MSTTYAENWPIDTATANNSFSALWKLSRTMKAAGYTYKASGNGTSKDTSGTASSDLWGGNVDPTTDTYPASQLDTRAAWWCAEGPSTVKIGIGAASSGTFLRGEIVTQATSGATGELIGYVLNAAGNSGWLIIAPQTGTFDGTHQIVGGTSGATVTATSYNLIRRQIVFAKTTNVNDGWIFYEAVMDTEIAASSNTALFSDLAANASNCTATTAPGNSASTNNLFPSYGISLCGAAGGGSALHLFGSTTTFGKAQIVCVNATPSSGVSADGSFWMALSNQTSVYYYFGLQRLDDTEPGDADPYAFVTCNSNDSITNSTTARTAGSTLGSAQTFSSGSSHAKGYCARTTGTMGTGIDSYCGFTAGFGACSNVIAQVASGATATRIRNHPDNAGSPPYPIETIVAFTQATGLTMRKGTFRWWGVLPVGSLADTADNKKWLVVTAVNGTTLPAVVIGPMDGSTVPTLN